MVPNILWTKNRPQDYEKYAANENKTLLAMERIGAILVCCLVLIFSDYNWQGFTKWSSWLFIAIFLMLLYEIYWIRYFKSEKTMKDFYSSLLGVPVAGATLPVTAFAFLSLYGKNPFLFISVVVLGIGHIGIHMNHKKEIE